ncbi:MAG: proton-conducting transporter membrane subunit, partial [Alphaproteobacteria bacterium]
LIAYSSIAHMGFATLALSTGNKSDIESILVYMVIYIVANIGFFSCLINIQNRTEKDINNISDLAGLSVNSPSLAISIALYMFSFAGIPPLAGFFAKYYVFISLINEGLIFLATFALIASVIGAFYYIRFVKVMFFDEVVDIKKITFSRSLGLINSICFIFIIGFIFVQSITPLANIISNATLALN